MKFAVLSLLALSSVSAQSEDYDPCEGKCFTNADCNGHYCLNGDKSGSMRRKLFGGMSCGNGECIPVPSCLGDCSAFQEMESSLDSPLMMKDQAFTCDKFDTIQNNCDRNCFETPEFMSMVHLACDFPSGICRPEEFMDANPSSTVCLEPGCKSDIIDIYLNGIGGFVDPMQNFYMDVFVSLGCNGCEGYVASNPASMLCREHMPGCDFAEGYAMNMVIPGIKSYSGYDMTVPEAIDWTCLCSMGQDATSFCPTYNSSNFDYLVCQDLYLKTSGSSNTSTWKSVAGDYIFCNASGKP